MGINFFFARGIRDWLLKGVSATHSMIYDLILKKISTDVKLNAKQ